MSEEQKIEPAVSASLINSLPPGALALERFKLALSLAEDTSPEAIELRQQLMEEKSPSEDIINSSEQQAETVNQHTT